MGITLLLFQVMQSSPNIGRPVVADDERRTFRFWASISVSLRGHDFSALRRIGHKHLFDTLTPRSLERRI